MKTTWIEVNKVERCSRARRSTFYRPSVFGGAVDITNKLILIMTFTPFVGVKVCVTVL